MMDSKMYWKTGDTALYQLNYILGLNEVNRSYVSGFGTIYLPNIHHAITENDDTYGSFPGLVDAHNIQSEIIAILLLQIKTT